jgi:periplasmic divalent cation tolerance protein
MLIAWTTVPTKVIADKLAASAVASKLAVCVQIEGPITSHYLWLAEKKKTEEYRLSFKFLTAQRIALESWIHARHPYQTPEWIVVKADHVAEKYLSWAQANSSY